MAKITNYLLLLTLSVLLQRTLGYSCADTNTTTVIYVPNEGPLGDLRRQVESLKPQIEILNERYEQMHNKFTNAQNTSRLQMELLNSSNEILHSQIKMLSARLDQQGEMHQKFTEEQNTICSTKRKYPSNCAEVKGVKQANGIQIIQVDLFSEKPFLVSCNESHDGGWTVIQRRQDGSIDFYRNWAEYKIGFGSLDGEFFIGLDKLHALTTEKLQELLIIMSDFDGVTKYAKYDAFAIGDESEAFALKVLGTYTGDASDSLSHHKGQKFSTKDRDNDQGGSHCAALYKGAWWYSECHTSNLNGLYLKGEYKEDQYAQGINWLQWHGYYYSLKYVQMMIRPIKT